MIKLSDEEKKKLKRYSVYAAGGVTILLLCLLLMKCEGCSSKKGSFEEGKSHRYSKSEVKMQGFGQDWTKDKDKADFDEEKKFKSVAETNEIADNLMAAQNSAKTADNDVKATNAQAAEEKRRAFENTQNAENQALLKKLEELLQDYESATTTADKNSALDKAVTEANDLLKTDPENAQAHYILAKDAERKQKYELAIEELKKAVKALDDNYLYWYDLGKMQYIQKKYKDAQQSFLRSCELNNKFVQSRYNLGLTYVKLNRDSDALSAFEKAVEINHEYEKGYIEQAVIHRKYKRYDQAIKAYNKVIVMNPSNISARMELALVYYDSGNLAKAEETYLLLIERLSKGQSLTLAKYNLSKVLYEEKKYSQAYKYAWQAYDEKDFLQDKKLIISVVYNYANILTATNRNEEARKVYEEVLSLSPSHVNAKINLSESYLTEKNPDYNKVISLLTSAYKTDSKNFKVNNNLGNTYLLMEDYKNAIEYLKKAVEIEPSDIDALTNLSNAYIKNEDYQNAEAVLSTLISTDKNNWAAYLSLAKVCIQLDNNEKSLQNLEFLQKNAPDYRPAEVKSLLAVLQD